LVDRGLVESRSKAQALIMAGLIFSKERKLEKAGQQVQPDIALDVRGQDHPWASRGGLKLARAIDEFNIDPTDKICIDVGASTGGFTDVLIQNGATKVYAVDVGHGQLAWKLRSDERVIVLEKTNARYLTPDQIPDAPEIVVCDASFIGLRTVLPAAMALAKPRATLAALIKPQFEAGREYVGKGGVVRDPKIHQRVCEDIRTWLDGLEDWSVVGVTESPIKGPEGNIEFLIVAKKAL
jgi:23S rRNA (cytidine1920-2'-O)/16S rRNA (cytidine1409-2'-O)-methyltransferase